MTHGRQPRRLLLGIAIAALFAAAIPGVAAGAQGDGLTTAATDATVVRLAGSDRIATAIAVSMDTFDSADVAVLARADAYADALAGAPLAAANDAPVLLTWPDRVPTNVRAELARLGVSRVILLGGTGALSAGVEARLQSLGYATERIAGGDRFQTAALIAGRVDADPSTVFLVEGADADPNRGWPDALATAPYAAFRGAPILLTLTDVLPPSTAAALDSLAPGEVVVVGGTAAVADAVTDAVETDDRSVRRLAGDTRYTTAAAVYDEAVTRGMDPSERWLATGRNFPDALAAAAAAAHAGHPLLLVDGQSLANSPGVAPRMGAAFDLLDRVVLLGGNAAIDATVATAITAAVAEDDVQAAFCLTILHNNDGESQLVDAGSGLEEFGGVARFASRVFAERAMATAPTPGCESVGEVTLTSGDNFLAGPEFSASLDKGVPFFDSIAFDRIGYDVLDLGNHDFDFGPEVTRDLISGMTSNAPFLSANLTFEAGSPLRALADSGRIARSAVVDAGPQDIGVIGLTTPALRSISSPGPNTVIDPDVQAAVTAEVTRLRGLGIDVIVLISHLQGVDEDLALIADLSGVDVVVAGGGDEVLASPGELLIPGDETSIFGSYPLEATDADGDTVPVVTTAGDYRYVGRLVVRFGNDGELLAGDAAVARRSRMVRVAGDPMPDAVAPDPVLVRDVVDPVRAFTAGLAQTVIGTSQVGLDGSRPNIRQQETNLGNLMADALRDAAEDRASEFGINTTRPFVAIQNGGGIRNNNVIPPGDLSVLTTFDIAPFPNFVGVFDGMTAGELKLALENAYSQAENAGGRFGHISGMEVEVDLSQPAQEHGDDDAVTVEGSRVRRIEVAGSVIYDAAAGGFQVPQGTAVVNLATIDFLARGGDQYPFPPVDEFTIVGVSYQQALREFIEDDLAGLVSASVYPTGGSGRISIAQ